MTEPSRIVAPHYRPRTVILEDGTTTQVPEGWELLPPGDAGLTRRVKAAGPTWTVQQKKGRKTFSHGVWAPPGTIEAERAKIEAERETPEYQKRREADVARRERKQDAYVEEFRAAVLEFLAFDAKYAELADRLADAVTDHAVPVGSGTVARTQRISVAERAEAAVIAWMRHQTTAYDSMKIERVKGKRREVRRQLAQTSRRVLESYRSGAAVDGATCPLQRGLGL